MIVDAKDRKQVWYEAKVSQCHVDKILIHYMGWDFKYDEWLPRDSVRIQPLYTETRSWRNKLSMDDTVEVLCLSPNSDDVDDNRRWFRGVIQVIVGDLVLVEYGKRGYKKEIWLNIYCEDICIAGTHVPSNNSPFDSFSASRKNELLHCNADKMILDVMKRYYNNELIVMTVLKGLDYLLFGEDRVVRKHLMLSLQPEVMICQILSQYRGCQIIVELGCEILNDMTNCIDFDMLVVGDVVDTYRQNKGQTMYSGRITRIRGDGTCDIIYDNGDCEEKISRDMIFLQTTDRLCTSYNFTKSIITQSGHVILLQLLKHYQGHINITRDCLSILSIVIKTSSSFNTTIASSFMENKEYLLTLDIIHHCIINSISYKTIHRGLGLLHYLTSIRDSYKHSLFESKTHEVALACFSYTSHLPHIMSAALRLLTTFITKPSSIVVMKEEKKKSLTTTISIGELLLSLDPNNEKIQWRSTGTPVSERNPLWIDIPIEDPNR